MYVYLYAENNVQSTLWYLTVHKTELHQRYAYDVIYDVNASLQMYKLTAYSYTLYALCSFDCLPLQHIKTERALMLDSVDHSRLRQRLVRGMLHLYLQQAIHQPYSKGL